MGFNSEPVLQRLLHSWGVGPQLITSSTRMKEATVHHRLMGRVPTFHKQTQQRACSRRPTANGQLAFILIGPRRVTLQSTNAIVRILVFEHHIREVISASLNHHSRPIVAFTIR